MSTPLDSVLGRPGEPLECRTVGPLSVHWYPEGSKEGDSCFCGEKTYEPRDES